LSADNVDTLLNISHLDVNEFQLQIIYFLPSKLGMFVHVDYEVKSLHYFSLHEESFQVQKSVLHKELDRLEESEQEFNSKLIHSFDESFQKQVLPSVYKPEHFAYSNIVLQVT
jgi:hypothetical protein